MHSGQVKVIAIFAVIIATAYFVKDSGTTSPAEAECGDRISAFVMSQKFVTDKLKAPATASFPYISSADVERKDICGFIVKAYVDSENSFGANLRTYYSAELTYDGTRNKWGLNEITLTP